MVGQSGEWRPEVPVPADAPGAPLEHFKLGRPSWTWLYRNAAGALLGYVLRFDTSDGKKFLPFTFCKHSHHGRSEWRWKSWPAPRPLYNLDQLNDRPDSPIVVTEGEKPADAAADLLPDWVATTSPNGSNAALSRIGPRSRNVGW